MEFKISVHLDTYIAHPYWPEREKLINISKESGVARARTAETRRKALDSYLASAGMTRAGYEELQRLAARPFYVGDGHIIVPELHVMSMIVSTKTGPDGVWERFAVVSSGTGAKLSNQRALRADPYIEDADATGTIDIDTADIRPEVLWKALAWAGTHVGIGAARKMGWGRFSLTPL